MFETPVGHGVNHGHEAIYTGEDVKQSLPRSGDGVQVHPRHQNILFIGVDPTDVQATPKQTNDLDNNHVVCQEVAVAYGALLSP